MESREERERRGSSESRVNFTLQQHGRINFVIPNDMRTREEKGKEAGSETQSVIPNDMRQREDNYKLLSQRFDSFVRAQSEVVR